MARQIYFIKFFILNNKTFQTDFYLNKMTFFIYLSINVLPQVMKLHELKEKHKLNVLKSAEIPKFQVLRILKAYSSHRNDVWSA